MADDDRPIHVESHGQQGGITAGIINIQNVPQPQISISDQTHTPTEAGHQYEAILSVKTVTLIPKITVVARGRSVEGLNIMFQGTGIMAIGQVGTVNGDRALELLNPTPGNYKVTVLTKETEDIKIDLYS